MNLWQLRVFQEIMQTGSVSQAARNLNRTQSAISSTLAKLEDHIGYALFERRNRRLHPAPEAFFLKSEAESILDKVDFLDQALSADGAGKRQQIRIACMPLIAEFLIPRAVEEFSKQYPQTEFFVTSRRSQAVYQAISTQRFDVGVGEYVVDTDLVDFVTFNVECFCALPPNDPLASRPFVTPSDLDGKPCASFLPDHFISKRAEEIFGDAGCRFDPQFRFQNAATSGYPLIANGLAYGIFSPLSIWINKQTNRNTEDVVYVRMSPPIAYPFAILTPAHRPLSRLVRSFLKMLRVQIDAMISDLEKEGHFLRLD